MIVFLLDNKMYEVLPQVATGISSLCSEISYSVHHRFVQVAIKINSVGKYGNETRNKGVN